MSFNIPITVNGDVSMDGITRPGGEGSVRLGSVLDLVDVSLTLNEDGDMQDKRCAHCKQDMDPDRPTHTIDGDEFCDDNDDEAHESEWSPLTWAKNVQIDVDEEEDQIDLTIATGDPRGGWQLRLRRDPETGAVYMSVPFDGMADQHGPMRQIGPGTYAIG